MAGGAYSAGVVGVGLTVASTFAPSLGLSVHQQRIGFGIGIFLVLLGILLFVLERRRRAPTSTSVEAPVLAGETVSALLKEAHHRLENTHRGGLADTAGWEWRVRGQLLKYAPEYLTDWTQRDSTHPVERVEVPFPSPSNAELRRGSEAVNAARELDRDIEWLSRVRKEIGDR